MIKDAVDCTESAACPAEVAESQHARWTVQEPRIPALEAEHAMAGEG